MVKQTPMRSLLRKRGGRNVFLLDRAKSSQSSPSINRPEPSTTTTWERSAIRVKNTDKDNNPYLEAIRDTHDPTMHLKTIEDELKGTIGKALGKQGEKILTLIQKMQEQYDSYKDLLEKHQSLDHPAVQARAIEYNEIRKQAIQARWELMVHRQAAGFIVNNHGYVTKHYTIPEAQPVSQDEHAMSTATMEEARPKKQFGDQLDWWQRIGRWR